MQSATSPVRTREFPVAHICDMPAEHCGSQGATAFFAGTPSYYMLRICAFMSPSLPVCALPVTPNSSTARVASLQSFLSIRVLLRLEHCGDQGTTAAFVGTSSAAPAPNRWPSCHPSSNKQSRSVCVSHARTCWSLCSLFWQVSFSSVLVGRKHAG